MQNSNRYALLIIRANIEQGDSFKFYIHRSENGIKDLNHLEKFVGEWMKKAYGVKSKLEAE
jgi:hypothetical protein